MAAKEAEPAEPIDGDDCMGDGCEALAEWFEDDPTHWHDWIWCDEHAVGHKVVPLYGSGEDSGS